MEFDLSNILSWAAVIAVASAAGAFLADLAKPFVLSMLVSRWQERQELKKVFERYKKPLTLSATELANRLTEIVKYYPTTFLALDVLKTQNQTTKSNSDEDPYFKKYKFISTLYRFCALLGWLELFRRDTVLLASGNTKKDERIWKCIENIRIAVSDGHLNTYANRKEWKDHLVYREELRAIGESMVRLATSDYQIMGYADFEHAFQPKNGVTSRWILSSPDFFADPAVHQDFRRIRHCLVLIALCELIELLSEKQLEAWLSEGRDRARKCIMDLNYSDTAHTK